MPRDVNIQEIVTKMIPVRAVDLSIGPFCTEFRCERFCDDDVFLKIDHQGREIGHRGQEIGHQLSLIHI